MRPFTPSIRPVAGEFTPRRRDEKSCSTPSEEPPPPPARRRRTEACTLLRWWDMTSPADAGREKRFSCTISEKWAFVGRKRNNTDINFMF